MTRGNVIQGVSIPLFVCVILGATRTLMTRGYVVEGVSIFLIAFVILGVMVMLSDYMPHLIDKEMRVVAIRARTLRTNARVSRPRRSSDWELSVGRYIYIYIYTHTNARRHTRRTGGE